MSLQTKLPLREIVFGLEDGTVSTLGVLVGIAAGTQNKSLVVLTGLVVIFVESLSMGAGTFLSNKSELQLNQSMNKLSFLKNIFRREDHQSKPLRGSLFMLLSYIIGGFIALTSFIFLSSTTAIISSVIISFLFLFTVGFIKGRLAKISPFKSGLEMVAVSASASLIGFIVGKTASLLLPNLNI